MTQDEVIVKILIKASTALHEPDQGALRMILEQVLADYIIEPQCRALAVRSDLPEHITMYLATK